MIASCMIDELLSGISGHYFKSLGKHKFFAGMFTRNKPGFVHDQLEFFRAFNDVAGEEADAVSLLDEEVLEMQEAYLKGDKDAAVDEAYDAIAVLMRIIYAIKDENWVEEE